MSEIRKCACSTGATVSVSWETLPRGYCVRCWGCGRSGPVVPAGSGKVDDERRAIAAWNADRLAEEKAREALMDIRAKARGELNNPTPMRDTCFHLIEVAADEALRLLEGR